MTTTLALLAVALIFVLFLIRYAPWRHTAAHPDELSRLLEPISVPAMMNLIDGKNLEFLERSLPANEFRQAKRERCRTLRVYVRRIAHNTRILIATAEVAQRAADAQVAESGRVLLEASLATRTRAMRALASLYVSEIFPGFLPDLSEAIQTYQSAAARLDSLQALNTH
ncbi:MAG TPA: hypothetical protein VGL89_03775 [Candidatus Koribacter sp.]|jgi:hypothetical protein